MVYSGAIGQLVSAKKLAMGDAVQLADADGVILGWGVYNPTSMFRVRYGMSDNCVYICVVHGW